MEAFLAPWFDLTCRMIPQVTAGILLNKAETALAWPPNSQPSSDLTAAAELAISQSAPVISNRTDGLLLIAYPMNNNQLTLALTIANGAAQQQVVIQLLEWSQAWLALLLAHGLEHTKAEQLTVQPADFVAILLQDETAETAYLKLTSHLALQFSCDMVSLGLMSGDDIIMTSLSHCTGFDSRINLVAMIEEVMIETIQMHETELSADTPHDMVLAATPIVHPAISADDNTDIDLDLPSHYGHERLASELDASICTVPLVSQNKTVGALCFTRSSAQPFSTHDVQDMSLRSRGIHHPP